MAEADAHKHLKALFLILEVGLLAAASVFAVSWALHPKSHFDSLLAVATTLLLVLELVRRLTLKGVTNPFVARLSASGGLHDLLSRTLAELEKVSRADYNQIFLNNQSGIEGRLLAVADSIPAHKQRYRIATYDGLLGSAYSTGRTINADDVRQLKGYYAAVPETQSELVVPIRSHDTVLGVINSESEDFNHFTDEIQEHVQQLADALGQVLPQLRWDSRARENDILWIQKSPPATRIGNQIEDPKGFGP